MPEHKIRFPDDYGEPLGISQEKKWKKIISLFLENKLDELGQKHRTGARGRILSVLSLNIFDILQIPYESEPIFYHVEPNPWYIEFAKHHDIKIRTHDFYNPDLFLEDGTWVEITLSENTAYQKLFRYGHQADNLVIYWLDKDEGYHKKICQNVRFPNVEIKSIECFNPHLQKTSKGQELVNYLKILKRLKGIIA